MLVSKSPDLQEQRDFYQHFFLSSHNVYILVYHWDIISGSKKNPKFHRTWKMSAARLCCSAIERHWLSRIRSYATRASSVKFTIVTYVAFAGELLRGIVVRNNQVKLYLRRSVNARRVVEYVGRIPPVYLSPSRYWGIGLIRDCSTHEWILLDDLSFPPETAEYCNGTTRSLPIIRYSIPGEINIPPQFLISRRFAY